MKSELITMLAGLPDADPRLEGVRRALFGNQAPAREPLLTLREVGQAVRLGYSQLFRLGVPDAVADRSFGGRPRYRLNEVEAFLRSPACQARRAAIRAERGARKKTNMGTGRRRTS
jgi:hypothetical protein